MMKAPGGEGITLDLQRRLESRGPVDSTESLATWARITSMTFFILRGACGRIMRYGISPHDR
jgi:hypothetical protein